MEQPDSLPCPSFLKRHRKLAIGAVAVALAVVAACVYVSTPRRVFGDGNVDVTVEKTLICVKSPGTINDSVIFSDDGTKCAYIIEKSGKKAVVLNGVEGPVYDSIEYGHGQPGLRLRLATYKSLTFSRDGNHLAYIAGRDGREFVVCDGREGKPYDAIDQRPVLSGDGRHLAYVAVRGEKKLLVVDGVEGNEYDSISYFDFRDFEDETTWQTQYERESALLRDFTFRDTNLGLFRGGHAEHIAYGASKGRKWVNVVDGVEGKEFDSVNAPAFSQNLARFGYAAKSGDKWLVVADGVEGKPYDEVSDQPHFTPDGGHMSYVARRQDEWFAVTDGVEGQPCEGLLVFEWSPDGLPSLYSVKKGAEWYVVADGVEGKPYDRVQEAVLSPGRKRMAYIARVGAKRLVVAGGVEGKPYDYIEYVTFSPDGRRLAYTARVWEYSCIVADGVEGAVYDAVSAPDFSADGKHLIYVAFSSRNWLTDTLWTINRWGRKPLFKVKTTLREFVVVDNVKGPAYDTVHCATGTPDGRHLAWLAERAGKCAVFVDGMKKARCPTPLRLDESCAPGIIRYVAEDDKGYWLVNVTVTSR